jgi:hypothetical protein
MRRMVHDGAKVFRVVVVQQKRIKNPDYVQGGQVRYWLLLDETEQTEYGPYNSIGPAKAVLTRETIDTWNDGGLKWGVVGGWIEKAAMNWEKVDLGGDQV